MNKHLSALINYAIKESLIMPQDINFVANSLISIFELKDFKYDNEIELDFYENLDYLLDYAVSNKLIEDNIVSKDLFDTKVMGVFVDRPSNIVNHFFKLYLESPEKATDYFYHISSASNYIRRNRIAKNIEYDVDVDFGKLLITINKSKPEKDAKIMEMERKATINAYPTCPLCPENEGYSGSFTQQARENLRMIPLKLNHEDFFMQYSPYVYFNEHSIILSKEHVPMNISDKTFKRLFDFLELFPHYFIGSNAGLPIVGGSMLYHEHYQGGRFHFPIEDAKTLKEYKLDFSKAKIEYLDWPLETLRLTGERKELEELAERILDKFKTYEKKEINLVNPIDDIHHSITPISRLKDGKYQLDLVLRSNYKGDTEDGLYHPSKDLYHIKKENIGLIEVMGLAILPGRLDEELKGIAEMLLDNSLEYKLDKEPLLKHKPWYYEIKNKHEYTKENVLDLVKRETGIVFGEVLKCCGVFRFSDDKIKEMDEFIEYLK